MGESAKARRITIRTALGFLTFVVERRGMRAVMRPNVQYAKYLEYGGSWRRKSPCSKA